MTFWLMMLHYNIKFCIKIVCSSENITWTNTDSLTLAVTLTLNAVIHFSHRALRLMMLYYQTKFGCKHTSTLEDIAEIVTFDYIKPLL